MKKMPAFEVKPLVCGECGNALPVMGRLLAFQCPSCFNYWIAGESGLEPITVFRAAPPMEIKAGCTWLPFWIVSVDIADLHKQIESTVESLKSVTQAILETKVEFEQPRFEERFRGNDELDPGLERSRFINEASAVKRVPAASELAALMRRLAGSAAIDVYVPAFSSPNTYAYLKVGRLLTRLQPSVTLEKSDGAGRPVLCALTAGEAVDLIDFIYFATLPPSLQENGDLLERIHLKPLRSPRLVELPFMSDGSSLVSLIGNFWISKRLVEAFEPEERHSQAQRPEPSDHI